MRTITLLTAVGTTLFCSAASFAQDNELEPFEVNCSLTITPEYNNLVKQVTIWGEINLPFTNEFDFPVSSVVVSVLDATGVVITAREMFGSDQSMKFMMGTDKTATPILPGVTTKMIHQDFNQVLWSMNLYGIEDAEILQNAASMMEEEGIKLKRSYSAVKCRIDGVNK